MTALPPDFFFGTLLVVAGVVGAVIQHWKGGH